MTLERCRAREAGYPARATAWQLDPIRRLVQVAEPAPAQRRIVGQRVAARQHLHLHRAIELAQLVLGDGERRPAHLGLRIVERDQQDARTVGEQAVQVLDVVPAHGRRQGAQRAAVVDEAAVFDIARLQRKEVSAVQRNAPGLIARERPDLAAHGLERRLGEELFDR